MRQLSPSTSVSLALAAALLSACAQQQTSRAPEQQRQILVVQVCLPDRRAEATEVDVDVSAIPPAIPQQDWEDLRLRVQVTGALPPSPAGERTRVTLRTALPDPKPPSAPRTVGSGAASISKGVASDSSGGWPLADVTRTGQPVYEVAIFREPHEVLGVHVLQPESKEPLQYWYVLPSRAVTLDRFTDWMPPRFQEPISRLHSVRSRLFSGEALPVGMVSAGAPVVRVTAIEARIYWARTEPRTRALRMQHLMELTKTEASPPGHRPVAGAIPSC